MKEFICEVCGKRAISTAKGGIEQRYCSKECRGIAANWRKRHGGDSCPYNDGVSCVVKKCESCGWNPVVEKRRKEALHEEA